MRRWYALTCSQKTSNGIQLLNCVSDAGLVLIAKNICAAEITTATVLHRYPRQYAERQLPKTLALLAAVPRLHVHWVKVVVQPFLA